MQSRFSFCSIFRLIKIFFINIEKYKQDIKKAMIKMQNTNTIRIYNNNIRMKDQEGVNTNHLKISDKIIRTIRMILLTVRFKTLLQKYRRNEIKIMMLIVQI
jgi:hypothetical protein